MSILLPQWASFDELRWYKIVLNLSQSLLFRPPSVLIIENYKMAFSHTNKPSESLSQEKSLLLLGNLIAMDTFEPSV